MAVRHAARRKKWESALLTVRKMRPCAETELNEMEISSGIFISSSEETCWDLRVREVRQQDIVPEKVTHDDTINALADCAIVLSHHL